MLKLVIYPDPILDKIAEPVVEFNEELVQLVEEMYAIMKKEKGIGLAAPQVGVSKRIFVTEIDGVKMTLINPEIVESHGELAIEEGCLSFPGLKVKVQRKSMITMAFQRTDGTKVKLAVGGLASICYQHELDHLNGITFIEVLSKDTKTYIKRRLERLKNAAANKQA